MLTVRLRRAVPVLVGLVLASSLAMPGSAQAQQGCLPAGEVILPVPWPQQLLAPQRAWGLATGAGQRVAVVSTGVSDTPVLAGAVAARSDFAPAEQFGEPSGEIDCLGIGTGVAGIVAAPPGDGQGFHGMAPDAEILDAKVVGDQFPPGAEPAESVAPGPLARGIDWAVSEGATVIVVPTVAYQDSDDLQDAVDRAIAEDVVVVATVGDEGTGDEGQEEQELEIVPYPAGYPGVIGVGAINEGGLAEGSRAGHVDLVAPGTNLITAYRGDGLGPAGGTSFAAAYVAGSVALLRSYRPELTAVEVAQRLFATAAPAPESVGSARYGYGVVNPHRAMTERVVAGEPVGQPPYAPVALSDEERARQAAQEASDALASRLVLAGLAVATVVLAAVGFGARGRRRRWRAGLAPTIEDHSENDRPSPPRDLFDSRPPQGGPPR